jgi:hemerythrin
VVANVQYVKTTGDLMAKLVWTDQFILGVEVIDQQHRTILDYVNQLDDARNNGQSKKQIGKLINKLVEYTLYHFSFEEGLQEKAGYPFLKPHQKSHALIAKHVIDFQARFDRGEDISKDMDGLLANWLFDHLKHDDADYVRSVNEYLLHHPEFLTKKTGVFARLFGLSGGF